MIPMKQAQHMESILLFIKLCDCHAARLMNMLSVNGSYTSPMDVSYGLLTVLSLAYLYWITIVLNPNPGVLANYSSKSPALLLWICQDWLLLHSRSCDDIIHSQCILMVQTMMIVPSYLLLHDILLVLNIFMICKLFYLCINSLRRTRAHFLGANTQ